MDETRTPSGCTTFINNFFASRFFAAAAPRPTSRRCHPERKRRRRREPSLGQRGGQGGRRRWERCGQQHCRRTPTSAGRGVLTRSAVPGQQHQQQ